MKDRTTGGISAKDAGLELVLLARVLRKAADIEFKPSPKVSRWEAERRAKSISNETFDVASDEPRLAVRAAVVDCVEALRRCRLALEDALALWHRGGE